VTPLKPGSVIGILGGGQLGRMLAMAAARLGLRCHVYCPDEDRPAAFVAAACTAEPYGDEASLKAFAASVDVVTYEFENVPGRAADFLASRLTVRPGPEALIVSQDRVIEKSFARDCGIDVPAFAAIDSVEDLVRAIAEIGLPAVLKTRRFGYDGKGQVAIRADTDLAAAWAEAEAAGGAGAILERWVDFALEISIVVARGADGETVTYVPVENRHEHHILRRTTAPAPVPPEVAADADVLARRIAGALDLVGVLAVEMFVGRDGRVLVNELAPRVHNSGHWTGRKMGHVTRLYPRGSLAAGRPPESDAR